LVTQPRTNFGGKQARRGESSFRLNQGPIQGGIGAIAPPKTYESNFIHNDFVQFRKKHSRYKAILPSIVLSQQCCEVYFTSLAVLNPWLKLDCQILLKLPP